jgi:hypothetical protein
MGKDDSGFRSIDPSLPARLRNLADDLEDIDRSISAISPEVILQDWFVMKRAVPCLVGRAIGHPMISDRHPACTSELYYLDGDRGVARTLSRWYRLERALDTEPQRQ